MNSTAPASKVWGGTENFAPGRHFRIEGPDLLYSIKTKSHINLYDKNIYNVHVFD